MKSMLVGMCVIAGCAADRDDDLVEDADAITGCNSVTTVILYSENTYELTLPKAFAAAQDPCTRYYVDLPHLPDPTMPRPGADLVHTLGPNFYAMAEFSWSGWHDWVAASPGTRNWYLAGKAFRQRMIDAGYDVAAGDTWVINEFPSSVRTNEDDARTHIRNAVRGLYEGNGPTTKGVAFTAAVGQTLENFSVYKPNVANWLSDAPFWVDMNNYVRWFAYEVYADPHTDCVAGSNVEADSDHLSAYLEHIPRLAEAGDAATATAASYLERSYVPLVNEAWNSNVGFGNNLVPLAAFEKFSRLQVYATHVWAANHAYPGRRIGFAWSPHDATVTAQQELAGIIARSVARAYPANRFYNLGNLACSESGSLDGCGCQISGGYNNGWATFARW
jgi:hypothetical protein